MGIGKRILQRMAELGIKTNVALAERMKGRVHPNSIGKWVSEKSIPRGSNLIALAKALNISVDLLVMDDSDSAEKTKSLERMVSKLVMAEVQKTLKQDNATPDNEILNFLKSEDIPQEDKEIILRQIRNLLKLYKKEKTE